MASRFESGGQPRRRIVTYGKTAKRTTSYTRAREIESTTGRTAISRAASEGMETMRQQRLPKSPSPQDDSSPEPLSLDKKSIDIRLPSHEQDFSTDRKRKIASIYSANEQGQDPLSEESSPVAPRPKQRSRVSSPSENASARSNSGTTRRLRSTSADVMDVDGADGVLSSPPPTPTALKEKKTNRGRLLQDRLPFSPDTVERWENLRVGDRKPQQHQIPIHLASAHISEKKPSATNKPNSKSVSCFARPPPDLTSKPAKKPRRRFVDTLKEQMEESDGTHEEKSDSQVSWAEPIVSSQTSDISASSTPAQTPRTQRKSSGVGPQTFARSGSSLKYTYGQSKMTLLEEENLIDALEMPEDFESSLKGRRLELNRTQRRARAGFDIDEEDALDASPKSKMQNIHQLKHAGESSRVADEMFDLSTQIGQPSAKPSSPRRTALLQIAENVGQKEYLRQLRDHGIDAMILKNVGAETDVISGYLISTILLHILTSSTAPHIIQLLRAQDAGVFFGHLLGLDEDIRRLVRDRKNNMSKRNQTLLLNSQTSLLQLPIWQQAKPTATSPRSLALKCLELILSQDVRLGSDNTLFPTIVSRGLFDVLAGAQETEFWDNLEDTDSFDVHCALSVLEYHAVKAIESSDGGDQLMSQNLPVVADAFGAVLRGATTKHNDLESLLLKLVMNMTNSSTIAPDIFVGKGLLPPLSVSICTSFTQSIAAVAGDDWAEGVLDGLVLRLGILINFVEQSTIVRKAVHESPGDSGEPPLKQLIRIFLAHHRATAEADSEAKSRLNVAFGYLSVLLGYLCLYAPIREVFRTSHSAKSLGPLLASLQEFISHHRALEASVQTNNQDDPRVYGGYTDRLQGLVDQLEADAAAD